MTDKCIAFGCTTEVHSGSNLCYHHLPVRPLEEAKEELKIMKEELEVIRGYEKILKREAEGLEQKTKDAYTKAVNVYALGNRKELAVKKFERELSRYDN